MGFLVMFPAHSDSCRLMWKKKCRKCSEHPTPLIGRALRGPSVVRRGPGGPSAVRRRPGGPSAVRRGPRGPPAVQRVWRACIWSPPVKRVGVIRLWWRVPLARPTGSFQIGRADTLSLRTRSMWGDRLAVRWSVPAGDQFSAVRASVGGPG